MRRRDFLGVVASAVAGACVGVTAPSVGVIRVPNNAIIRFRGNANNADVQLLASNLKKLGEFYNRHVHHHSCGPSRPPGNNADLLVFG